MTFEGSQIREEYLQNLVPFKKGDYYQSRDLAELNRRLSATGWFNSVVVAPEFDKSRKTKVLPLHGVVSPRTENTIETGVGYSTDVGPRVKATWKKPWMNSYGSQPDHQRQYLGAGTAARFQLQNAAAEKPA